MGVEVRGENSLETPHLRPREATFLNCCDRITGCLGTKKGSYCRRLPTMSWQGIKRLLSSCLPWGIVGYIGNGVCTNNYGMWWEYNGKWPKPSMPIQSFLILGKGAKHGKSTAFLYGENVSVKCSPTQCLSLVRVQGEFPSIVRWLSPLLGSEMGELKWDFGVSDIWTPGDLLVRGRIIVGKNETYWASEIHPLKK